MLTPASFWPILADCADTELCRRQFKLLDDPDKPGGAIPFPSMSRDDPAFSPAGTYWCGSVWLPTAYMCIKSLEQCGEYEQASQLSLKLLRRMIQTWKEYEPHTIWECYSPTEASPGTNSTNKISRKNFCGWSALAPIS